MSIHVPRDATVLAMDVHENSISAAVLEPGGTRLVIDRISTDDESVRRLIARFEDPRRVRACHEAGPTGYELPRTLRVAGMRCVNSPGASGTPPTTWPPSTTTPALVAGLHLAARAGDIAAFREEQTEAVQTAAQLTARSTREDPAMTTSTTQAPRDEDADLYGGPDRGRRDGSGGAQRRVIELDEAGQARGNP